MELKAKDFSNKITKVAENSIAQELDIQVGDILLSINSLKETKSNI